MVGDDENEERRQTSQLPYRDPWPSSRSGYDHTFMVTLELVIAAILHRLHLTPSTLPSRKRQQHQRPLRSILYSSTVTRRRPFPQLVVVKHITTNCKPAPVGIILLTTLHRRLSGGSRKTKPVQFRIVRHPTRMTSNPKPGFTWRAAQRWATGQGMVHRCWSKLDLRRHTQIAICPAVHLSVPPQLQ